MREWARLYGRQPSSRDWSPAQARRGGRPDVVAIFEAGDWPHSSSVSHLFGSWNAAIVAAGFTPRRSGGQDDHQFSPRRYGVADWPVWTGWRLAAGLRHRAGLSQTQVATAAHVSTSWVTHLENGECLNPQIRPLIAYARAIGVHPAVFMEGEVSDDE